MSDKDRSSSQYMTQIGSYAIGLSKEELDQLSSSGKLLREGENIDKKKR